MITAEIRELAVILALVEEGGFAGAAKKLGVTQPAVSGQIAKLEQNFGFSIFHRRPEGAEITDQGKELLPLIMEIQKESKNLRRRASYWKRAMEGRVRILADGSNMSQSMRPAIGGESESWQDADSSMDWATALLGYEIDIVLSGSFLKEGAVPGIKTTVILKERGMTCAWNPDYLDLDESHFDMPAVIASSVILPAEPQAVGFRKFLRDWCGSTYGSKLDDIIDATTETNAVDLCQQGLGTLLMPGDVVARLGLRERGLCVAFPFGHLLPESFTFGVRHREDEKSPAVLDAVRRLSTFSSTFK